MARGGRNSTAKRWHRLRMPESRAGVIWSLISGILVWWTRTNGAVLYFSTKTVQMQGIRYEHSLMSTNMFYGSVHGVEWLTWSFIIFARNLSLLGTISGPGLAATGRSTARTLEATTRACQPRLTRRTLTTERTLSRASTRFSFTNRGPRKAAINRPQFCYLFFSSAMSTGVFCLLVWRIARWSKTQRWLVFWACWNKLVQWSCEGCLNANWLECLETCLFCSD
jgi:hypothetical protein